MLVLSRKPGEKVVIGNSITVTVVGVSGNKVRLAFAAPDQVRILRAELACWQAEPAGDGQLTEPALVCGG
jgi:carbon storage regulator